jgi:O-methyltransferase involved in polyketide biosynthesis
MAKANSEKIGPTAHYTAYVWHRFGFPHAELFATPKGAALFWSLRLSGEWITTLSPRVPSLVRWLGYRHRLIELAVERTSPDRVVEVGAGLSRRGITFAADRGIEFVEMDLPHMIAVKKKRLARAPAELQKRAQGKLQLLEADALAAGFARQLAEVLAGAKRPAVITEGVLPYFDVPDKIRIMRAIREALAAAGGGTYVTDGRTRRHMKAVPIGSRVVRGATLIATRGRGHGKDFEDEDDVRRAFREAGFTTAEIVDPSSLPDAPPARTLPGAIWQANLG